MSGLAFGAWLASALHAAAAPTVTHSQPVPVADPGLRLGWGTATAVAASNAGWLAVYESDLDGHLKGRRLDAQGEPFGAPFAIALDHAEGSAPRVVFDGSQFVVVWLDLSDETVELCLQRVSTQGELIGSRDKAVVPSAGSLMFDLARGPSGVVVMFCGFDDVESTCRTWTVPEETGLEPADVLPAASPLGSVLDVEFSGDTLLAALESGPAVELLRADAKGEYIEGPLQMLQGNTEQLGPTVAPTSDGFAVLWRDEVDTRLAQVSRAGVVTTEALPLIAANDSYRQRVVAVPQGFLLFAYDAAGPLMRRYSTTWQLLGEPLAVPQGVRFMDAALAVNGSLLLTSWQSTAKAEAMALEPSAVAWPAAKPISVTPKAQEQPHAALGPDGGLIVWFEEPFLRARLLDEQGAPMGSTFTLVTVPDKGGLVVAGVSGHPGGRWLVLWYDTYLQTHAVVYDAQMQVVGTDLLEPGTQMQCVATKDGWVVAFNDYDDVQNKQAVVSQRIDLSGKVAAPMRLSQPLDYPSPFDITALPGSSGAYRVWWEGAATVVAADVSASDQVTPLALPAIYAPDLMWLTAAQGTTRSALAWHSQKGFELATTASADVGFAERLAATDLTQAGETSLMGWWRQDDNTVELAGPGDDGAWSVLDVVPDAAGAYLSAGDDSHALLVFYRPLEFYGSESYSLHTSVVSVGEALGGAGAGGAGTGGAEFGAGEAGLLETGGVGATMAAGASSLAGGAESTGDGDADEATSGTSPMRTSRGCSCGVAGQSDSHSALLLSGALAALAFRRRNITRR